MKAFSKILRNKLSDKMRNKGYPDLVISTTEGIYEDINICIGIG
jgi:hypothetical protein